MVWLLFAGLCTLLQSVSADLNRIYKCDGLTLNCFRALVAALCLFLFLPFSFWPSSILFYAAAIVDGIIGTIAVVILLDLTARTSGRVSSMYIPACALIGFVGWSVIDPASVTPLVESPWRLGVLAAAFIVMGIAVNLIRRNDTSWMNFVAVLPVAVIFALLGIIMKLVIDPAWPAVGSAITYCFVAFAVSTVTCVAVIVRRAPERLYSIRHDRTLQHAALWSGITSAAFLVCLTLAVLAAPNPAYVCILTTTVPFWIWIYHRLRSIPDHASPYAGFALLAGAGLMIWAVEIGI